MHHEMLVDTTAEFKSVLAVIELGVLKHSWGVAAYRAADIKVIA